MENDNYANSIWEKRKNDRVFLCVQSKFLTEFKPFNLNVVKL